MNTVTGESGFTYAGILATIDLFAHLDRLELARLAGYVEPITVSEGTVVCQEGDAADGIYVIMRGSFGVFSATPDGDQEIRASTLTVGDYFGEMILLDAHTWPHTVRAEARASLLHLPRERALDVFRLEPNTLRSISMILRRRASTQSLSPSPEAGSQVPARLAEPITQPEDGSAAASNMASLAAAAVATATAAGPDRRQLLDLRVLLPVAVATGLAVVAATLGRGQSQAVFLLLLAAVLILRIGEVLPDLGVALLLVAGWVLTGIATPHQALAGFATSEWLFVLSVLGLAVAIAQSGLLYRVGLMLVRRTGTGLIWQAGAIFLTGILLLPLLPISHGRMGLTAPIAATVAEALRLKDREGAAAFLGLAAWLGSAPLMFIFLNGEGVCLIAWGLLPEASRLRFDWIQWFLAAAPLGIVVGLGAFVGLYAILRPRSVAAPARRQLNLQLAVLGPLSRREVMMMAILALTVLGWIIAPSVRIDMGVIGMLALVVALCLGLLDAHTIHELDWSYLVYLGVLLGIHELVEHIGLDHAAQELIRSALAGVEVSPPLVILGIACLSLLVRLVLAKESAIVVLGLMLVPAAPVLGLHPWVIIMTLLATSVVWFLPSQSTTYVAAYSATGGRLFSHGQARWFALVYTGVTLGALLLMIPYWSWLGLL